MQRRNRLIRRPRVQPKHLSAVTKARIAGFASRKPRLRHERHLIIRIRGGVTHRIMLPRPGSRWRLIPGEPQPL